MARRKKNLGRDGCHFFIFMGASAGFENWIRNERERDALNLTLKIDSVNKQNENVAAARIENMDSPYDDVFGVGQLENNSLNHFVIINEMTDIVICAVQNKSPFKTIRNEYLKANTGFFMRQLPDGFYHIKFYTGKKWNRNQSVPDGRKLGGFTEDELFYEISGPPFYLIEHSNQKSASNSCDTIIIGPANKNLKVISKETFFSPEFRRFSRFIVVFGQKHCFFTVFGTLLSILAAFHALLFYCLALLSNSIETPSNQNGFYAVPLHFFLKNYARN